MKNRAIAVVILALSFLSSLHGVKNFLQELDAASFDNLTVEAMTKKITDNPALLNQVGEDNETTLITAIADNKFELAIKLIELGADTQVVNQEKRTLLDMMIQYLRSTNELDVFCDPLVQQLLQKKVQVSLRGLQIIVKITKKLDNEIKKIIASIIEVITDKNLINEKIDYNYLIKNDSKKGNRTLLHWTVQNNLAQASAALILNGADLTLVDHLRKTALGYAMIELTDDSTEDEKKDAFEKKEVIKTIIELLPNQNPLINSEILLDRNLGIDHKCTFLVWAASNLHKDVCELLIKKGVLVALKIDGKTALSNVLQQAFYADDEKETFKILDIVFLLWNGHEASYVQEDIPLLEAIKAIKRLPASTDDTAQLISNFEKMIKVFIEKIDIKDEKYKNILAQAIPVGFNLKNQPQFDQWIIALEEILKKDGLDLNQIFQGRTPLHLLFEAFQKLSSNKHLNDLEYLLDVIKKLIEKNPNLSHENNQKQNPLHYAVLHFNEKLSDSMSKFKKNYLKIIQMLVEHGSPIKNALDYLLAEQVKASDEDVKNQLWEVIKIIIQAVPLNNSDQLSELKDPELSVRVINLAGSHDEIDFLKHLKRYDLDFKSHGIKRDQFFDNFKIILDTQVIGLEHATKTRPQGARGRKKPTRKPTKFGQKEDHVNQEKEEHEKLKQADKILLSLRVSKSKCEELLNIVNKMMGIYNSNLGNVKKNNELNPLQTSLITWKKSDDNKNFLSVHQEIDSSGIFNISDANSALIVKKIIEEKIAVINGEIDKITPAEEKASQEKAAQEAKKVEETKKAEEQAAEEKLAQEKKLAEEKEKERLAEEQQRMAHEKAAEAKIEAAKIAKIAEEKAAQKANKVEAAKKAEEQAALEKLAQENKLAEEKAAKKIEKEKERLAEEKRIAEEQEKERLAQEIKMAEEKVAQEKILKKAKKAKEKAAQEKAAQEKLAQEKKLAEEKAAQEAEKIKKVPVAAQNFSELETALGTLKDKLKDLKKKLKTLKEVLIDLKVKLVQPVK